jgi:hypothetical protein
MPTSSELVRKKREDEAWEAHMARVRAAEAAKQPWPVYVPPVDPPATPAPKKDEAGGR